MPKTASQWRQALEEEDASVLLRQAFESDDLKGMRICLEAGASPETYVQSPEGEMEHAQLACLAFKKLALREEKFALLTLPWPESEKWIERPVWDKAVLDCPWALDILLSRPLSPDDFHCALLAVCEFVPADEEGRLTECLERVLARAPETGPEFTSENCLHLLSLLARFEAPVVMPLLGHLRTTGRWAMLDVATKPESSYTMERERYLSDFTNALCSYRRSLWDPTVIQFLLDTRLDRNEVCRQAIYADRAEQRAVVEWTERIASVILHAELETQVPVVAPRPKGTRL